MYGELSRGNLYREPGMGSRVFTLENWFDYILEDCGSGCSPQQLHDSKGNSTRPSLHGQRREAVDQGPVCRGNEGGT